VDDRDQYGALVTNAANMATHSVMKLFMAFASWLTFVLWGVHN
jgi:hypothetical protein